MAEEKTNAAIRRFKTFLRNHPEIVAYVHKNDIKWRDVFDDWVIFGESHEVWEKYGLKEKSSEDDDEKNRPAFSFHKVLKVVDNIDAKQWQERLETISGAITGIQSFIGQFRQNSDQDPQNSPNNQEQPNQTEPPSDHAHNPFFFRRD
ncbi:YlbD family protein [Sporolactobacillus inulinus]|uniref:Coat protein n=1 Tax=Sporolactobacillus inulinus TaxID=2078 RepID=A0A4Y3T6A5_9BACL|nr:spore coat protein YlbD [Sporolactobacillus inulinus]GAY76442.1 hypothetical protein BH2601 [Sporolactobacillus inulinus]GEB77542.1 hypothetical protein SIN01_18870 [Sporolactobacillus inulinus]